MSAPSAVELLVRVDKRPSLIGHERACKDGSKVSRYRPFKSARTGFR